MHYYVYCLNYDIKPTRAPRTINLHLVSNLLHRSITINDWHFLQFICIVMTLKYHISVGRNQSRSVDMSWILIGRIWTIRSAVSVIDGEKSMEAYQGIQVCSLFPSCPLVHHPSLGCVWLRLSYLRRLR